MRSLLGMTLKALVNLIENNKNFTADQKLVYQKKREEYTYYENRPQMSPITI
jgi:hypothetical protein